MPDWPLRASSGSHALMGERLAERQPPLRPHYDSAAPEVDFGGLATFNLALVFIDDVPESLAIGWHTCGESGMRLEHHGASQLRSWLERSAFVRVAGHNETNQIGLQATIA